MKKILIFGFVLIIILPSVLKLIYQGWNIKMDVPLKGYSDSISEPDFSYKSFVSGEFQSNYTAWTEENLLPRGIFTKTYASLQYNLFHQGNRVIGKNNDIFEEGYIFAEYALTDTFDISVPETKQGYDNYVDELIMLQKKLEKFDKSLYFYVAANKAEFDSENVPDKYKAMHSEDSINIIDYLRSRMEQTSIPYRFCADIKDELEYPPFYSTGIHWSRTYEQRVTQKIISDLSENTGKNYRNIVITGINESNTPFGRDSDVYDLLNVWNKNNTKYYEYSVEQEHKDSYDKMKILLWGDSFAEGLWNDITYDCPNDSIYYINYSLYVREPGGNLVPFNGVWENVDMQRYLDNSDVVILGCTEHNLATFSCGFVQYLNQFLDTYVPNVSESIYCIKQPITVQDNFSTVDISALNGIYAREGLNDYLWMLSSGEIRAAMQLLGDSDLQIVLGVPSEVFIEDPTADTVNIYINGNLVHSGSYTLDNVSENVNIVISRDELLKLSNNEDYFTLDVEASKTFNVHDLGLGEDSRDLALRLYYIGGAN